MPYLLNYNGQLRSRQHGFKKDQCPHRYQCQYLCPYPHPCLVHHLDHTHIYIDIGLFVVVVVSASASDHRPIYSIHSIRPIHHILPKHPIRSKHPSHSILPSSGRD
ncbi:hypothetical protein CPB83DRAFT_845437 [Crepidotus variabilis]|uniref:Uncharacterized protein n=1 Tax=Crepidotus variabilis TaxID=179855 RepID=A0A9P6ER59_9AGAR|nr:hypothetical protein CPB83DRAFT_845437 [Crepidotus variabilis]